MSTFERMPLPTVLRSEQHLLEKGLKFAPSDTLAPVELPISPEGVTFDMAQSAAWVDADHFAVGRWDGSLTLFKFSESKARGPLIAVAASSPSSEGVQMITWVAPGMIATSNDERSIALWKPNSAWDRLELAAELPYDPSLGAANSGDAFPFEGGVCMVAGHANGFVTIWKGEHDGTGLAQTAVIDVRNGSPTNPWDIHNVRGVAALEVNGATQCVITGSENGDLCVIDALEGKLLSRASYNTRAERGINAVSASGLDVLVANCSVGPDDHNLWLYTVNPSDWSIQHHDAVKLKIKADAPQVFNFAVVWGEYEKGRCFFASTQEGTLWMGTAAGGKLSTLGYKQVTAPLGAALAYASNGNLAFVAYDLYEFKTLPGNPRTKADNPQRFG